MDRKSDLLDDISQVSEISLRSLFKERVPDWKKRKEEFIEPFYPHPKMHDEPIPKRVYESKNEFEFFRRW
jgi:hypothetical protein